MRVPGLALCLVSLAGAAVSESLAEFSIYSNRGFDNDCKDLIARVEVTDKGECHTKHAEIRKYEVHKAPEPGCKVVFYGNTACSDEIGLYAQVMRIFPSSALDKCSSTIGVLSAPIAWRLECRADGYL